MSRRTRTPTVTPAQADEGGAAADAAPLSRIRTLVATVTRLQPVRAVQQMMQRGGMLLASAMAYHSIFAIFAAIWVFFTIVGLWLRGDEAITDALFASINQVVPGLIGEDGPVDPKDLLSGATLSWTGAVALVGLLWKTLSWMDSTRKAIRVVFGLDRDGRSFVMRKVVDIVIAAFFAVLLIASALMSVASSSALTTVFTWVHIDVESFWAISSIRLIGLAIAVALNAAALALLYRVLSKVRIPLRILAVATIAASIVMVVMSGVSGLLLGGAGTNPLLASFAVFIGLLIWFNLISLVILFGASWMAVAMEDRGLSPRGAVEQQRREREQQERARLVVAEADVDDAARALASARWPSTITAKRRLKDARARRDRLLAAAEADDVGGTQ